MSAMDWKTIVGFTVIFHGIVYAWKREWVLHLDTKKCNSFINSIGQQRIRKYFRPWFRLGSYVTITLGFPFTVFLFLRTLFHAIVPSLGIVYTAVTSSPLIQSEDQSLELHHDLPPFPDVDFSSGGGSDGGSSAAGSDSDSSTYLAIQPILPGWNLPLSQLPYYLLAILISVVIHELGHAMASASHKIPIQSVGVTLFGPLIPAAHVELNSVQLRESPIKKQLDILTAGVWMNIYLALIAYFVVPKALPAMLWPTHSMGNGLTVTAVWPHSGVGGPSGLMQGDVITGIENCPVKDLDSWYTCLEHIWGSEPIGYCVSNDTIVRFANNSEGCCVDNGDTSMTHLCFQQLDVPHYSLEGFGSPNTPHPNPNVSSDISVSASPNEEKLVQNITTYCLPAQPLVAQASFTLSDDGKRAVLNEGGRCHAPSYKCSSPSDRTLSSTTKQSDMLDDGFEKDGINSSNHCFLPRLVRNLPRFRIVQIYRRQHEPLEPVLFVGNVMDLYNGLRTTDFVPRSWPLSRLFGFSMFSKLPEKLETVLLLTAGLSAGLAVVNMLPIYGLDGYHIVDALLRAAVAKKVGWEGRKISNVVQYISVAALFVALLTIFCSLAQATL